MRSLLEMKHFKIGFAAQGIVLLVEESVRKIWSEHRQKSSFATEACGILMATVDTDTSRIWLEKATMPSKADRRTRFTFKMAGKNHEKHLRREAKNSKGRIRLLGTWHTHPENDPTPSKADLKDWRKLQKTNPQFQEFCFVIVGLKKTTAYLYTRKKIIKMKFIEFKSESNQ